MVGLELGEGRTARLGAGALPNRLFRGGATRLYTREITGIGRLVA
jgi:hypothetical protein